VFENYVSIKISKQSIIKQQIQQSTDIKNFQKIISSTFKDKTYCCGLQKG